MNPRNTWIPLALALAAPPLAACGKAENDCKAVAAHLLELAPELKDLGGAAPIEARCEAKLSQPERDCLIAATSTEQLKACEKAPGASKDPARAAKPVAQPAN